MVLAPQGGRIVRILEEFEQLEGPGDNRTSVYVPFLQGLLGFGQYKGRIGGRFWVTLR